MNAISFFPTVFEHAASLIGQTPSAVAQSAELMRDAHVEAFRRYGHGAVTVGIDVYNIEAEALGCKVRFYDDNSIPGIIDRPLVSPKSILSYSSELGRIQQILDAATAVKNKTGANVSVGICGPFSILIELVGFENAVGAFADEDEEIELMLEKLLVFQMSYCNDIATRGLGVTVFESWASPPLVSPDIYLTYAFPYEKRLFSFLDDMGVKIRPLVIGGNTTSIVENILKTGTTLLVSDFNTPLLKYADMAKNAEVTLRANIDPKLVLAGEWEKVSTRIAEIYSVAETYPKIIAGTGVIPYDTPPENLLRVKKMLLIEA